MAIFSQYAMAATEEALEDAGWKPSSEDDRESTVRHHAKQPEARCEGRISCASVLLVYEADEAVVRDRASV